MFDDAEMGELGGDGTEAAGVEAFVEFFPSEEYHFIVLPIVKPEMFLVTFVLESEFNQSI